MAGGYIVTIVSRPPANRAFGERAMDRRLAAP